MGCLVQIATKKFLEVVEEVYKNKKTEKRMKELLFKAFVGFSRCDMS
jgi:hypothetical protein